MAGCGADAVEGRPPLPGWLGAAGVLSQCAIAYVGKSRTAANGSVAAPRSRVINAFVQQCCCSPPARAVVVRQFGSRSGLRSDRSARPAFFGSEKRSSSSTSDTLPLSSGSLERAESRRPNAALVVAGSAHPLWRSPPLDAAALAQDETPLITATRCTSRSVAIMKSAREKPSPCGARRRETAVRFAPGAVGKHMRDASRADAHVQAMNTRRTERICARPGRSGQARGSPAPPLSSSRRERRQACPRR
eukprot:3642477-Prymnesium_polylepis.2